MTVYFLGAIGYRERLFVEYFGLDVEYFGLDGEEILSTDSGLNENTSL